jgi:hypothetical protein
MQSPTLSRPLVWGLVLLLGLAVLSPPKALPAQDTSCAAVDRNDQPRPCTFLEEHGGCLWYALDSYYSCVEDGEGFLDRVACEVAVQVDLLACNLGLPWRLIKSVVS